MQPTDLLVTLDHPAIAGLLGAVIASVITFYSNRARFVSESVKLRTEAEKLRRETKTREEAFYEQAIGSVKVVLDSATQQIIEMRGEIRELKVEVEDLNDHVDTLSKLLREAGKEVPPRRRQPGAQSSVA